MNVSEPGWDLYRSFLAVVREGSLSGAARRLGLTQPTVGRHVEQLEAALGRGRPLFTRSPQGLLATEAARAVLPHAEAMEASAAALVRTVSGGPDEAAGVVRITASQIVGAEVLPPMLTTLRRDHPGLSFELVLSNASDDLLRRQADIAVRMTRPKQDGLHAKRIGVIRLGLYARPDYLARFGAPKTAADLADHTLIGFDTETVSVRAVQVFGWTPAREAFALRSDSDLAQLAMLRAGFGLGVCQVAIGEREGLTRVMADQVDWPLETWVVMHEDLRASRRLRTVFDGLAAALAAYAKAA